MEALAEAWGGVKPRKHTPETGEGAMDLSGGCGVVENEEIRRIPSPLPAPTPKAVDVRANWDYLTISLSGKWARSFAFQAVGKF